jgi:hypothetical protein
VGVLLCSCGRAEASPYGIRALGQWIDACELCAAEVDEERRLSVFDGSARYDLRQHDLPPDSRCAWCGTGEDLLGEVVNGGCWVICEACFIELAGQRPWSEGDHRPRFLADLSELRVRHAALTSGRTPRGPALLEPFDGDVVHAFLFHDSAPLATDEATGQALYARYQVASSPAWVVERFDQRQHDLPAFLLGVCPVSATGHDGSDQWLLVHDGTLIWAGDAPPEPTAVALLNSWGATVDLWAELVAREAETILAVWQPDGVQLHPEITGTPRQHWDLRLTLARVAAVQQSGPDRERALDALCGLGWYGDERPDLIPTAAQMATASWPVHPVIPTEADVRRGYPYTR